MKFSVTNFFNKCDQIRSFRRIWSYLLKKYLMEKTFLRSVSNMKINEKIAKLIVNQVY